MIFIETNYFIRFLLADILSQHTVAEELLLKGTKEKAGLCASVLVMFAKSRQVKTFTTFNKKVKAYLV